MVYALYMSPKPPSRKGVKLSEETKKRISESCKLRGVGKWMSGKKLSEEVRQKMSDNSARYWAGKIRGKQSESTKKKRSLSLKGHKVSELTRKKVSLLSKGKFGEDHPCYKVNKKHPLHKSIRETFKYKEWRKKVFERDNYSCVLCLSKGYLEADHIVRFIDIINKYNIISVESSLLCEELFDLNNGRTLCRECHIKTDTWGKKSCKVYSI